MTVESFQILGNLPVTQYCTIHGKRCHILQEVGLLPVGPRKVFYFPSTTHWKPMEAFPYPPPGDAPSRGYRLPRGLRGITSGF
ncbi:hypothetical protein TNCV_4631761 [Trichonephila clavipes]|nr:hypothetical protein TNCV_4631761 [Trichonephila clavipes]